ncbi:hypothetical protein BDR05DRAFT_493647 [Suillus weaverae]|nr:hypothetical protein BDR05DRAFT_493647 [Suillus weaverae]
MILHIQAILSEFFALGLVQKLFLSTTVPFLQWNLSPALTHFRYLFVILYYMSIHAS